MRLAVALVIALALCPPAQAAVVGDGTARSCTSRAVVRAVANGGVIRFRCGPRPVRIEMRETAKVVNTSRRVVLDGGGRVTLSGHWLAHDPRLDVARQPERPVRDPAGHLLPRPQAAGGLSLDQVPAVRR